MAVNIIGITCGKAAKLQFELFQRMARLYDSCHYTTYAQHTHIHTHTNTHTPHTSHAMLCVHIRIHACAHRQSSSRGQQYHCASRLAFAAAGRPWYCACHTVPEAPPAFLMMRFTADGSISQ